MHGMCDALILILPSPTPCCFVWFSVYKTERGSSAKAVGVRWKKLIAEGKWELREDMFWAQPRPLWEMPSRLRKVRLGIKRHLVRVCGGGGYI